MVEEIKKNENQSKYLVQHENTRTN